MSVCRARAIEREVWELLDPEDRARFPPCQHRPDHPGRHDWQRPDDLVHQMTEVSKDKGARTVTVKCGTPLPKMAAYEGPRNATAWASAVTCPACLAVTARYAEERNAA